MASRSDLLWRSWRTLWFLLVAAVFFHAVWVRFSLPQWPLLTADSPSYLAPALSGRMADIGPRTFPYPLFCWSLLALAGDWRALSVGQHLLGLLGPALLLLAWCQLGQRLHSIRLARALHDLLGLAMLILLLPSSSYAYYEQLAMLESFHAFLQCCLCALLCLLWLPASSGRRLIVVSVTSFLGVAMYYVNPRWGAAAPWIVLLAAASAILLREPTRGWLRAAWPAFAAAGAAWLAFGLPQALISRHDPWARAFTPKHLLWMRADLAAVEFRRELAASPPPRNAELLRTLEAKITPAVVGEGASGWATIPFNAEKILYGPGNPDADLIAAFHDDPDGYIQFCLRHYLLIIRNQPGAFLARVGRELSHFYAADGAMSDFRGALTTPIQRSVPIAQSLLPNARPAVQPPLRTAIAQLEALTHQSVEYNSPRFLFPIDDVINAHLGALSLLGALAAGVVLLRRKLRGEPALAVTAGVSLAALGVLFFQILTLALVTAAAPRYGNAARTLIAFSIAAVLSLGLHLGVALVRKIAKPLPGPAA